MLMDRIMGAFTFRKGVYAEVEKDASFTQTAWLLVAVIALLNQLGTKAGGGFLNWLLSSIIGTIFALLGFAIAAWLMSWVGSAIFKADVDFGEMVRALGLAYVWNIVGFIGILAFISPALGCILSPITFIAFILGIIAWLIAAKEALDLDWLQTIVAVIIGWVVYFILLMIAGVITAMLGLTVAGIGSLFG